MRFFKNIGIIILFLGFFSCQEDDLGLDTILVPTNLTVTTNVSDDGSGIVEFNASAENAITYKYVFPDGSTGVAPSGKFTKRFTRVGLNTYQVTVVAYGKAAVSSSTTLEVEVRSDFNDPETKALLTGGSSKTWYVASAVPGHLGVGQNVDDNGPIVTPNFFAGSPGFGPDCFYDDELTFSLNAEDNIVYTYENFGVTFMNWQYTVEFGGNGEQFVDECLDFTATGEMPVSLVPASSGISADQSTGTMIEIADGGFMSYYIGTSQYEVLEISEERLYVRAVQGNDDFLAWYLIFTPNPDGTIGSGGDNGGTDEPEFNNLIWEDDFNGDTLDSSNWNYEIGNGENGWGNNEAQYYTDSPDNVKVENGNLVITAKRESESGFDFTSARITTKDKVEFTYGRVEARAKLPAGGGVWPAIWMLGAEWPEQAWPGVGEMDIMEFVGNQPDRVISALHYPENFGGNAIVGEVTGLTDVTSEFHTYEVIWTEDKISFLMDGNTHLEFDNDASTPFHDDFYLLLNIAMGGTLGGDIDPNFQESSMEIDYIRVYQ